MKVKLQEIKTVEIDVDLDEILCCFNMTQEQWDSHSPAKQEQLLIAHYEDTIGDIADNVRYEAKIINKR